ncbi:hypothetical protein JCM10207_005849 [Rhodosporidiobolus poonsookiae]
MLDRPALSISVARKPSLRETAASNAAGLSSAPSSPLSALPSPHTPQNAEFDSGYVSSGMSGLQTPPMVSGGLFPPSLFPGRRALLRRNSSLSSVSSSIYEDDGEEDPDWTEQEEDQVRKVYDAFLAKTSTTEAPFPLNGPPPPNFTNMVARAVVRSNNAPGRVTRSTTRRKAAFFSGSSDVDDSAPNSEVEMDEPAGKWKHSLKNTRMKVLSLVKESQNEALEATPRQSDVDATPKRRKPLARSDSMDFIPDLRNMSSIARLSNMLRQPSTDGSPFAPSMSASLSASGTSTPPIAPSAFSHSASRGDRFRVQRTNSLHSIAGSPSQPKKASKRASASDPDKDLLAPPKPSTGKRMTRIGSESSVLPAPPLLARTLSHDPRQRQPSKPPQLGAAHSPVKPSSSSSATLGAGLSTPPSSAGKKSSSASFFAALSGAPSASPTKPNPGLTIDAALSHTLKRPQDGLASAFHSPVVGVYPSPQSASPKKKKAKVSTSPVRQPVFTREHGHDPLASGLGLGLGGMDVDERNPFFAEPDAYTGPAGTHGGSITLVDPSRDREMLISPCTVSPAAFPSVAPLSLESRRESAPPKLVLTPSLSPSSSSSSLSGFGAPLTDGETSPSSAGPGTPLPSPLSAAFDLITLKLDGATPPASAAGAMEEAKGEEEGQASFLNPEYVRAGNEARALRDQFGSFSWAASRA